MKKKCQVKGCKEYATVHVARNSTNEIYFVCELHISAIIPPFPTTEYLVVCPKCGTHIGVN